MPRSSFGGIIGLLKYKRKKVTMTPRPVTPVCADDEFTDSSPELNFQDGKSQTTGHLSSQSVAGSHPSTPKSSRTQEVDPDAPKNSWIPRGIPQELAGPAGKVHLRKTFLALGLSPRPPSIVVSPLLISSPDSSDLRPPSRRLTYSGTANMNNTFTIEKEPEEVLFSKPTRPDLSSTTPTGRSRYQKRLRPMNLSVEDRSLFKAVKNSPAVVELTKFTRRISPNIFAAKSAG